LLSFEREKQYTAFVKGWRGGRRGWRRKMSKEEEVEGKDVFNCMQIYRVSQEERSIFQEVIVSVILSKKLYMKMCPIPNSFRVRTI
jgi:hypothetical protein